MKLGTELWWKYKRTRTPVTFVQAMRRAKDRETALIETYDGRRHEVLTLSLFTANDKAAWMTRWNELQSEEKLLVECVPVKALVLELARAGKRKPMIEAVLAAARRLGQKEIRVAS